MSDDSPISVDKSDTVLPVKMRERVGPVGVGGWLMFFGIAVAFLAPLVALGSDYHGWKDVKTAVATVPMFAYATYVLLAYDILISGYGMFVGFVILKGYPQGARRAREFLWVRLVFGIVSLAIAQALYNSISLKVGAAATTALMSVGVNLVISSMIWMLYFATSKRVRNTYG